MPYKKGVWKPESSSPAVDGLIKGRSPYRVTSPSLLRNRNFRRLLAADAVSHVGTQVTLVALPLTAVVTLQASPMETGLLSAAQTVAFLLLGLPAGVWVDRLRRRPIMIAADLARAVLLLTLPVAWWFGVLTLAQLYLVAFGMSAATVFFDVAYRSYLPTLLSKDQLVQGNGAIETVSGVSRVAGPGPGGLAVQLLGGPVAVIADAVTFVGSALFIRGVDAHEAVEERTSERRGLWREIREGLSFVNGQPALRAIATSAAIFNFCGAGITALQAVFMVRSVGVTSGMYGTLLTSAALGGLLGAVLSGPLSRRVGQARIIWVSTAFHLPFALLLPLTTAGWGLGFFVVALFVSGVGGVVFNVAQASFRQAITPDALLGRVTASIRFIAWGVLPLGAVAGGAIGELYDPRTGLWAAATTQLLCLVPLLLSPLRHMRDFPGTFSGNDERPGRDARGVSRTEN